MTDKKARNIWFRMYSEALDDPKVQRLHPSLFKAWINLLCLASRHDGLLPNSIYDIAFALRASEHDTQGYIDELILVGLIDIRADGRFTPHNWCNRQFVSDTSRERVRKHRERKKNEGSNGDVTLHETPPDPDPESERELNPYPNPSPSDAAEAEPIEKFDLGGMGLGGVVSPEARRKAAARLGIADADPLVALYDAWPKSRTARDPDGLFLATVAKLFRDAALEVRQACKPLSDPDPPEPLTPVRPSAALLANLTSRKRHGVRAY